MVRKTLCYLALGLSLISFAYAQPQNCGDGNQYYVDHTGEGSVRYFAPINDFDIVRISEHRLTIRDNISCRYGTDTLVGIATIKFLDRTVTIEEFEIHERIQKVSQNILQNLLSRILAERASALGLEIAPEEEPRETVANPIRPPEPVVQERTPSRSPTAFSATLTLPEQTQQTPTPSFNPSPSPFTSPFQQPVYYPSNDYNSFVAPNSGLYYDQFSGRTFNVNTGDFGLPQNEATLVVTWPTSGLGPNDLVYFEATTESNQHHYLGSARGSQGSETLSLPNSLISETSVTISIRSGSQTLKTMEVTF